MKTQYINKTSVKNFVNKKGFEVSNKVYNHLSHLISLDILRTVNRTRSRKSNVIKEIDVGQHALMKSSNKFIKIKHVNERVKLLGYKIKNRNILIQFEMNIYVLLSNALERTKKNKRKRLMIHDL